MKIETEEDWWHLVDTRWDLLLANIYHVINGMHEAYEVPGNADTPSVNRDIFEDLEYTKEHRQSDRLLIYLEATFHMTSDARARSRPPGWLVLCDLCSEAWVFNPKERDYWVAVCKECKTAACWHGIHLCSNSSTADVISVSASSLRKLGLEHPDNFSREKLMEVRGFVKDVDRSERVTSDLKQFYSRLRCYLKSPYIQSIRKSMGE